MALNIDVTSMMLEALPFPCSSCGRTKDKAVVIAFHVHSLWCLDPHACMMHARLLDLLY